jgi:hypothetical protein
MESIEADSKGVIDVGIRVENAKTMIVIIVMVIALILVSSSAAY